MWEIVLQEIPIKVVQHSILMNICIMQYTNENCITTGETNELLAYNVKVTKPFINCIFQSGLGMVGGGGGK